MPNYRVIILIISHHLCILFAHVFAHVCLKFFVFLLCICRSSFCALVASSIPIGYIEMSVSLLFGHMHILAGIGTQIRFFSYQITLYYVTTKNKGLV